ncbi:hypothetical protein [Macrococcoides bohemicum]|uniref:hypothetical protein n=1 Tax=Macrococcoides bohemicum TaxID=1903056 RepID=UPI0028B210E3|nr:hypothetical protein [Macrococcus bohemicus]
MFIEAHYPDLYIQYLLAVEDRITLQENDRINLYRYKMGVAGERALYELLRNIFEGISIWDITLENNGSSQYDFIIVADKSKISTIIFIIKILHQAIHNN